MTSNPTGGTVDEAGQLQIKSIKPGDARVSIARTRLQTCFQSILCMVLVALAIRLIVMGFLYQEQLDPERDHWRFGYENGRLARSIVEGRGMSGPLFEDTGVSAWMTPIYPYFVAGVFKVFGVYSTTSAFVLLIFQALISALNCVPIYYFAKKLFGLRVAAWSGWAWAFFPYAIYFPVERIWGTWLSTLLVSVLLLITVYLEESARLVGSAITQLQRSWYATGVERVDGVRRRLAAVNAPVRVLAPVEEARHALEAVRP